MKLILSRKGFDSSAGGVPSPIMPDGRIVSLPIPDKHSPILYSEIKFNKYSISKIVSDLTKGLIPSHFRAHLDPDLVPESLSRMPEWRPLFGQTGAAQQHLRNNAVGPGDLFLFFGLFRQVTHLNGSYVWMKGTRPLHLIWGWLQIEKFLELGGTQPNGFEWATYHPHFHRNDNDQNVVYIANQYLKIEGIRSRKIPGGGVFPYFAQSLVLTAHSANNASTWELPDWIYPDGKKPLTYHLNPERWRRIGSRTELRAAPRGQEFVLDCDYYPEAIKWIITLLSHTKSAC